MAEPAKQERRGEQLRRGTLLADRYCLESLLGAGGFGVVWRARHVHLETECAVKLFDPPAGADPQEAGARFLQEARLTARLKCPHVARVFDYGVHDRMPFLVLELLHGTSLRSHLQALLAQGRNLSPAATARILRHVAEALGVAHAEGVVHRDLKPENIFLAREGERRMAKVLDFGIAKWSSDAAPRLTATHTLLGTAHYMSPEQFASSRQVDHRSDLWSLGVVAFECLTGKVPFPGESFVDVAYRVCRQGPLVASQLGSVPAGFDAWFARATALAREQRFASAIEQALALESICGGVGAAGELPIPVVVEGLAPQAAPRRSRAIAAQASLARAARSAREHAQRFLQRVPAGGRRRWIGVVLALGAAALALALGRGGESGLDGAAPVVATSTELESLKAEVVAPERSPNGAQSSEPERAAEPALLGEAPEPERSVESLASVPASPSLRPVAGSAPSSAAATVRASGAAPSVDNSRCDCKKPKLDLFCAMKCSAREPSSSAAALAPSLLSGLNTPQAPGPATGSKGSAAPSGGPGLEATAIQRTVRRYSPAVRQNCWQRALNARAPGVPSSAKVTATITVDPSGRVQSVTATGAPRGYPGLAHCIEEAVKGWTFPRSLGETVTAVPFMFVGQ